MKFIKVFLFILTSFAVLLAGMVVFVHFRKDQLIGIFLNEANKHIKTPVKAGEIDLSVFEEFPHVSVVMHDVVATESLPGSKAPLLQAGMLYCSFDAFDLFNRRYVVRQLMLKDAQVNIKYTRQGKNNFSIIEPSGKSSGEVAFDIERIDLKNVKLHYADEQIGHVYQLRIDNGLAFLHYKKDALELALESELFSHALHIGKTTYLENKPVALKGQMTYDFLTTEVKFEPTRLKIKDAGFLMHGRYISEPAAFMDLQIKGEQSNLSTLWSLLPGEISREYDAYRSEGKAWFNAGIKGYITRRDLPAINVDFGFKEAVISHPDLKNEITEVSFTGNYRVPQLNQLHLASLELKGIKGEMKGSAFSGELKLKNFKQLTAEGNVNAALNLSDWEPWMKLESLRNLQGHALIDLKFDGKLQAFQKAYTSSGVNILGEAQLTNVRFDLASWKMPFENITGTVLFNNRDIVLNQLKGKTGNTLLELDGFFKNIVAFALQDDQPLQVEADLKAPFLDIDQLLMAVESPESKDEPYYFNIDPRLKLIMNCQIGQARFRRFAGKNLRGQLKVNNQQALVENLALQMAGGKALIQAEVDARPEDKVLLRTNSRVEGVLLDSLFYVFEDFGQDFLQQKHLKGRLNARENSFFPLNRNLEINTSGILSAVQASIQKGELIDFEPLQALNPYFKRDKLTHCYFSDVENDILVKNRTIFLSPMLVHTNFSSFEVEGEHTFDQQMDYRIRIPLRSVSSNYSQKIATTGIDPNLFLTVKGTTEDFKIAYDKKAVKAKIRNDLREERQELKQAFKNKGMHHKDTVELSNEYFDF